MEPILTVQNIMFVMSMLAIIFSIFFYFKKPQEKIETNQLLAEKEVASKATILAQKEMENKATLLAQQVEWEKVANEKKFVEFGKRLDDNMTQFQKQIHTTDVRLEAFIQNQNQRNEESGNNFTKLFTILDERLPRNNNGNSTRRPKVGMVND